MVECVDPSRIDDIIKLLRRKYREIVKVIGSDDWIESITFNVKVCSNKPEHYLIIKLEPKRWLSDG